MDGFRTQTAAEIRAAIKQGDVDKVVRLIGADESRLEMTTPFGTWLHLAASLGKLEIVRKLISMGANVNQLGGVLGGNCLNDAVSGGHIDVVRYLLSKGAEMDVSDPTRNPLFGAIYGGHTLIAKVLIDAGIDTSVRYSGENMNNMGALDFAREWGRQDIVALLEKST